MFTIWNHTSLTSSHVRLTLWDLVANGWEEWKRGLAWEGKTPFPSDSMVPLSLNITNPMQSYNRIRYSPQLLYLCFSQQLDRNWIFIVKFGIYIFFLPNSFSPSFFLNLLILLLPSNSFFLLFFFSKSLRFFFLYFYCTRNLSRCGPCSSTLGLLKLWMHRFSSSFSYLVVWPQPDSSFLKGIKFYNFSWVASLIRTFLALNWTSIVRSLPFSTSLMVSHRSSPVLLT